MKQAWIEKTLSRWRWTAQQQASHPSIQPSRVGVCANPFARCGRSCVSHRWSDHEHKRVKFIWYRLRVWSCVVNVNFCAMLSRCQALCRNAAAIKCSHRDARPSALTGLIPGKVRILVGCAMTLLDSGLGDHVSDVFLSVSDTAEKTFRSAIFPQRWSIIYDQLRQIMCATRSFFAFK